MTARPSRSAAVGGTLLALALAVTACGDSADDTATPGASSGSELISVVASTNVYGDIAKQIGGDRVSVTSIIEDPSQDPHSYEANSRTQLALSQADVVVENGGGYDDFVDTMLKAAKSDAVVIDAVEVSGRTAAAGEELNEHVWYDFPSMVKLTAAVAAALSKADPAAATQVSARAEEFTAKLTGLQEQATALKQEHAGAGVAITEPVPVYLLDAIGLVNRTPEEFSEAIEEGEGVAPAVLAQTLELFGSDEVALLVFNEQTDGPETEKVLAAAKKQDVPAVGVTETLPAGKDYGSWMSDNLTAIGTALQ